MISQIFDMRKNEEGIALVTVLVFLVIMTIIGMAAMQSSSLQEKMSANVRDQNVSFQTAEAAAREGEAWVLALPGRPLVQAGNCALPCQVVWQLGDGANNGSDFLNPAFWGGANVWTGTAVPGARTSPKLIVEAGGVSKIGESYKWTSDPQGVDIFRVTARGTGETNDSQSVIQTIYGVNFN